MGTAGTAQVKATSVSRRRVSKCWTAVSPALDSRAQTSCQKMTRELLLLALFSGTSSKKQCSTLSRSDVVDGSGSLRQIARAVATSSFFFVAGAESCEPVCYGTITHYGHSSCHMSIEFFRVQTVWRRYLRRKLLHRQHRLANDVSSAAAESFSGTDVTCVPVACGEAPQPRNTTHARRLCLLGS